MIRRRWYSIAVLMAILAMAMAWLESAVVVYLRELYYPDGFTFPLVPMDAQLVVTEYGRELATIVMLFIPGALVTTSGTERFAWFIFLFGIWDIFYYVWLKVLLGWPASLSDPDILFLVPVPWVGPVWAPCLVSMGLILLALVILHRKQRCSTFRIEAKEFMLLIGGAGCILLSFVIGPIRYAMEHGGHAFTLATTDAAGQVLLGRFMPDGFSVVWYGVGAVVAASGILLVAVRKGSPRVASLKPLSLLKEL